MNRAVVTGGLGFIGTNLCASLLRSGTEVIAIDAIRPYYDPQRKVANLQHLQSFARFRHVAIDLSLDDIAPFVDKGDTVFHLAAQPGVRPSWDDGFRDYIADNVLSTQRVLATSLQRGARRVVYASSSSAYGQQDEYPCRESMLPRPYSPYGVTKLAGEHLCASYAENFGLSTVSLRFFTVFGPRQRPDMAIQRLIESAVDQTPFHMFGDGSQIRDFTFVDDVVRAVVAAADAEVRPGAVFNVAGGVDATLAQVIDIVADELRASPNIVRADQQPGDVTRTGGAIDLALRQLSWTPQVTLREGIRAQGEWYREHRSELDSMSSS